MSNYEKCLTDVGPRLKKRGFDNYELMSQNICQMRFIEDEETPRLFSIATSQEEKHRSFALDFELDIIEDAFPANFDESSDIWEFPVLAITSGLHKYTENDKEQKVYIESNILKDTVEAFNELPIYVNHQRTPDDLIGKAINPEIKEMDNGKIAIKMLAQLSNNEKAYETMQKMKDGDVTNVSIDWFSKDIDVMGDTYATNIRPVEVSFIDNKLAKAVCDECTIDMKCDEHEKDVKKEPCDGSCSHGDSCECEINETVQHKEDETMAENDSKTEAEVITEREFASLRGQLEELQTAHTELQKQYNSASEAITTFEKAEAERAEADAEARKSDVVNTIIDKELLLKTLEEDSREARLTELVAWEENKLVGFSEAIGSIPVPEDTERSFGKGVAHEDSEAPVNAEAEIERMFALNKGGKITLNKNWKDA
tara:strand:- start:1636 stop:2916 length:1281 start_codon:yes stop_codon:yes gene_type:complete